jgi:hypothetical protein
VQRAKTFDIRAVTDKLDNRLFCCHALLVANCGIVTGGIAVSDSYGSGRCQRATRELTFEEADDHLPGFVPSAAAVVNGLYPI